MSGPDDPEELEWGCCGALIFLFVVWVVTTAYATRHIGVW